MRDRIQTIAIAAATAMVTALLVSAVNAVADSNPATDQVAKLIPYQGNLEKDGVAVTGAVKMVFQLFDGASATTPAWDEELTVQVYAGRFTALLGSSTAAKSTALATALNNADDLYLAVSLKPDGTTAVPLSNRQRFLPVPYAMWTTASSNFNVAWDLKVAHNASVKGQLEVGSTAAGSEGSLWVGNAGGSTLITNQEIQGSPSLRLSSGNSTILVDSKLEMKEYDLLFKPWDPAARGDGGRAMVQEVGEILVLNYQGDFAGGTKVNSNLQVTGNLQVAGTTKLGLQYVTCAATGNCPCPTGTKIIGGGGDCATSGDYLHESYPIVAQNRWQTFCMNGGSSVAPQQTIAVCARVDN